MDSEVENLIRLQQVDLKAAQLSESIAGVPIRIAALDRTRDAQNRAVEAAEKALTLEESKRRRLESDLKDQQQKAAKLRDQTSSIKTNEAFHALKHEIDFVEAEARRIEDLILASMIESDTLRLRQTEAREELANHKARLEKEKAEMQKGAAEMQKEIDKVEQDREQLRGVLGAAMLARYDRLASSSRKTALARASAQRCTACQMALRPQYWNEVRSGALLDCESCGRLLYFDPNMEPGMGNGPGAWTA